MMEHQVFLDGHALSQVDQEHHPLAVASSASSEACYFQRVQID
jgi:hypothetical protein